MRTDLLALLRCPECQSELSLRNGSGDDGTLACPACGRHVPIVLGIPRFVDTVEDDDARRTQASFGYEWTHFTDWQETGEKNFNDYFQGIDLAGLSGRLVLDAGCGMGRHARQLAPFAGHVVAVDFSRAIDQARHNVDGIGNVDCVQGDLLALPLADASFDFVYSLGVLHHVSDTERALKGLARKLRPGGRLRVYLYWKRHGWTGGALRLVTAARRLTTRLPFPLLRGLCWLLSGALMVAVVLPYRALSIFGVRAHENWPLFVYAKYPFGVLYNDQFDRFSAPIEKRYDRDEVTRLLEAAGLQDVNVRSCFGWIADGTKPA